MKKRELFVVLFSLIYAGSFSQTGSMPGPPRFNPTAKLSLEAGSSLYYPVVFTDNTGRTISRGQIKDAEGSPYFNDDWQYAEIVTSSNQTLFANKIRVHLQANEIHYLNDNNQIIITNDGIIRSLTFTDSSFKIRKEKFACGFPAINGKDLNTFYEVLSEGDYVLLLYIHKNYVESKNELSGEIRREFVTEENLYVYRDNTMSELKKQKSQVLGIFKTDIPKLLTFIDNNKTNFKKTDELKKLFDYANSLH